MVCMSMIFQIICECNNALIVDINDVLIADIVVDFFEKLKELNLLLENMKKGHVFRFRDKEGD